MLNMSNEYLINIFRKRNFQVDELSNGGYKFNGNYKNIKRNINVTLKDFIVENRNGLKCDVSGIIIFNGNTYTFNKDKAEANLLKGKAYINTSNYIYEFSIKTNQLEIKEK